MDNILELIKQKDPQLADNLGTFLNNNTDIKIGNLSSGLYVLKDKYDALVNKVNNIQKNLDDLTKRLDDLDKMYKDIEEKYKSLSGKYSKKIKDMAINKVIEELNIKDPLQVAGIKLALNMDNVSLDDNLNIVGLDEQITELKERYADLFNKENKVTVALVGSRSDGTNNTGKKLITRAEFMAMSEADQKKYVSMLEF